MPYGEPKSRILSAHIPYKFTWHASSIELRVRAIEDSPSYVPLLEVTANSSLTTLGFTQRGKAQYAFELIAPRGVVTEVHAIVGNNDTRIKADTRSPRDVFEARFTDLPYGHDKIELTLFGYGDAFNLTLIRAPDDALLRGKLEQLFNGTTFALKTMTTEQRYKAEIDVLRGDKEELLMHGCKPTKVVAHAELLLSNVFSPGRRSEAASASTLLSRVPSV